MLYHPLHERSIEMRGASKCRASRAAAFTLVEIMIVVAIIGMLAAIAIPSFIKARQASQLNTCLNNLRIYADALDRSAFANHQFPASIGDLVSQGYLKTLHGCPLGGAYEWSVSNGNQAYHLRCTSLHTPTISHVCIHENQMPMAK
jgi:prepilin-type N-terminal cleavage/methylation domain-containing protein